MTKRLARRRRKAKRPHSEASASYEPPRLWRVDLPGLAAPDADETSALLAQGKPSSPNVAPVTVFPPRPPPTGP